MSATYELSSRSTRRGFVDAVGRATAWLVGVGLLLGLGCTAGSGWRGARREGWRPFEVNGIVFGVPKGTRVDVTVGPDFDMYKVSGLQGSEPCELVIYAGGAPDTVDRFGMGAPFGPEVRRGVGRWAERRATRGDTVYGEWVVRFGDARWPRYAHAMCRCTPAESSGLAEDVVESIARQER
jgi:hypothetical protein